MNFMRGAVAAACLIIAVAASARAEVLPIPPTVQRTPSWCWAAVGSMIFRYHQVPRLYPQVDDQCSIVGGLGGVCALNCLNCRDITAGQMTTMVNMLGEYPAMVRASGRRARDVAADQVHGPLDADAVMAEIDARRPVIAGISPSGFRYPENMAEHVALVVGYETDETDDGDVLFLLVNDPFPFAFGDNPYEAAGGERIDWRGRYRIAHAAFVADLNWSESVWRIAAGDDDGDADDGTADDGNVDDAGDGVTRNPLRDP